MSCAHDHFMEVKRTLLGISKEGDLFTIQHWFMFNTFGIMKVVVKSEILLNNVSLFQIF
jgi:hypothetical protein